MIEFEIKAGISSFQAQELKQIIAQLFSISAKQLNYHDFYFDNAQNEFFKKEKELRIRKIPG